MRLRERHRLIRGRVTSFCVSRGYTASSFPPMEIEQPLVMGRSSSGRISKVSNWQDFRALISFIEIIIRRRNLPNETKLAQNSNILCECEKTRRRRRRREIKRGEREREREREEASLTAEVWRDLWTRVVHAGNLSGLPSGRAFVITGGIWGAQAARVHACAFSARSYTRRYVRAAGTEQQLYTRCPPCAAINYRVTRYGRARHCAYACVCVYIYIYVSRKTCRCRYLKSGFLYTFRIERWQFSRRILPSWNFRRM